MYFWLDTVSENGLDTFLNPLDMRFAIPILLQIFKEFLMIL